MYSARPSLSLGFAKIADGSRLACFPPLSYGLSQITDHPSILHPNILTSLTWRYWGIHTPVSTWETALWPSYSTGILKLNSRIGLGAFKHFHHLSSGEGYFAKQPIKPLLEKQPEETNAQCSLFLSLETKKITGQSAILAGSMLGSFK